MKLFYAIVFSLMLFVVACAQQPETPPVAVPEPQPAVEEPGVEVAPVEEGEEIAAPTGDEVRMLGVGQYDPEEVTISTGGSVTFFNEGNFKTVVTIKGPLGATNTPVIEAGDKYEQAFEEAGEYDAWGVAYGLGVKITVE